MLCAGILHRFCNLLLRKVYCDHDLALRRDDLLVQLLRRGVQHKEVRHCTQFINRIQKVHSLWDCQQAQAHHIVLLYAAG